MERNQSKFRHAGAFCALAGAVFFAGTSPGGASPAGATPVGDTREALYSVPVVDGDGRTTLLKTRVCRPPGEEPSTLVVINHGSPPSAEDRP
jgi:hypothetical protein